MGISPNGYRYPDGNAPVRNGDNAIRDLAEQLPARLLMQNGPGAGQTVTLSSNGAARVTFPIPFDASPMVAVWCLSNTHHLRFITATGTPGGIDSVSFVIEADALSTGSPVPNAAIAIRWSAIGLKLPT